MDVPTPWIRPGSIPGQGKSIRNTDCGIGMRLLMKTKWIQIEGGIEIPEDMTFDEFSAKFEQMIEDKGWHLLAFTKEVKEND